MMLSYLNSLNTTISSENILEINCTYFKLFAEIEYMCSDLMTD